MRLTVLTFTLLYVSTVRLLAQPAAVELYHVKVLTNEGKRLRGILIDVDESRLYIGDVDKSANGLRPSDGSVTLDNVKRVILRRNSRRRPTITGAILGGLATGVVVVRSTRRNPFRSPVLYGLNLGMSVGAGAVAGGLLGNRIGNTPRRVIRPVDQTPDEAAENLRRQLEPFTYSHQNDVLNRIRP